MSSQTSTGNAVRHFGAPWIAHPPDFLCSLQAQLVIQISDPAVFQSLDNGAYQSFFSAITNTANVNFGLHGGANGSSRLNLLFGQLACLPLSLRTVTAQTAAGAIPIRGIPFDVSTSFEGIAGFGGTATIPASTSNTPRWLCERDALTKDSHAAPLVLGGGGGDPFSDAAGSDFLR